MPADETARSPGAGAGACPTRAAEPPMPEPEPEPVPASPSRSRRSGTETPLTDDPPTNPQEAADGGRDGLDPGRQLGTRRARRSQPGIAGSHRHHVVAQPVARLTFSSGEVVEVDRAVIVGRAPEARRFTSTEQPRLITVPSPNQEISSTHLEIRPGAGADHGSAVATDLGSTNGTVLQQPGLPSEDLKPGIAVQLIPGAIIDLGDGVTIQVGQA